MGSARGRRPDQAQSARRPGRHRQLCRKRSVAGRRPVLSPPRGRYLLVRRGICAQRPRVPGWHMSYRAVRGCVGCCSAAVPEPGDPGNNRGDAAGRTRRSAGRQGRHHREERGPDERTGREVLAAVRVLPERAERHHGRPVERSPAVHRQLRQPGRCRCARPDQRALRTRRQDERAAQGMARRIHRDPRRQARRARHADRPASVAGPPTGVCFTDSAVPLTDCRHGWGRHEDSRPGIHLASPGGSHASDFDRSRRFRRRLDRGGEQAQRPEAIGVPHGQRQRVEELHHYDRAGDLRRLRPGDRQRHGAARRHRHRHGHLHKRGGGQGGFERRQQRPGHDAADGRGRGRVSDLRTLQGQLDMPPSGAIPPTPPSISLRRRTETRATSPSTDAWLRHKTPPSAATPIPSWRR